MVAAPCLLIASDSSMKVMSIEDDKLKLPGSAALQIELAPRQEKKGEHS